MGQKKGVKFFSSGGELLTFGDILIRGQNGFLKVKLIAISIGFCTLFIPVIVLKLKCCLS